MKPAAIALSALLCAATAPASAQMINASDPDSIVAALQRAGFAARIETDSVGDPMIRSAARGANFSIFFYGCRGNRDCQDINFSAGFTMREPRTLKQMNDWNRAKLVGKVNIDDEGHPYIRHFVAGVIDMSPAAFDRLLSRWDVAFGEFLDHIDW